MTGKRAYTQNAHKLHNLAFENVQFVTVSIINLPINMSEDVC